MKTLPRISLLIVSVAVAAIVTAAPQYQIFDIGVVQVGDTASQGFGISPAGVAVGRSVRSGGAQAFSWTQGGGLVGLPNLAGRSFAVSNDANDSGIVVGTAANSLFGTSRLPVIWQSGAVSQLPLPAGETLGDANGVNALNVAVGSVDAGSLQQAVIYYGGNATVLTQTTPDGSFFLTAFGINNSARIVGQGIDPNNAARNVGIVYDMGSASAFEVGALPGANGALAFGVGNGGHVVGSSMMNQGSGLPFIWSQATGMVAIPLATGTTQGSARAVNSAGWVVGQDSSAFSIPFLWDGTTTYRLADLLPAGSGWDLSTNTSSSALGISDNGVIVGTGVRNGEIRAYAMVPPTFPTPSPPPNPCYAPIFRETFDGVTAPALPPGWVASFVPGPANCTPSGTCSAVTNWATSTVNPFSPPNCAFHNAPDCVTDSTLDSPSFFFNGPGGTPSSSWVAFSHRYDLPSGFDGAVLEISVNGGPFADIITAGGTFLEGGYNGTISAGTQSPIAGRPAWTGTGSHHTRVSMPLSSGFQNVRFRFRLATDCSGSGMGWRVDSVDVVYLAPCPSATPSPPGTPTPTPTPTPPPPTPTATPGQCSYVFLDQTFDGVTAPALPAGWSSSFTAGPADCLPTGTCPLGTNWATSTINPTSPPNCAFHNAPGCATDSSLFSPTFFNGGAIGAVLVFDNHFDLEAGRDGAVLEISINGGPFVDFVTAGGLFNAGGYNGTMSTAFHSPIGGRQAWTGTSTGSLTVARMPDAAAGQGVVLRFRLATDCSGAGTGQHIDNIRVTYFAPCLTPTPTPSTSPDPIATHFEVIAPTAVGRFQAFNFTVRALDQSNNTVTNYAGTIHFTSTSQGLLPPNSTMTNGFGTFSANLQTLGNHTITATDTVNTFITGTSNNILVINDLVTPPPSPTPTATATPTPSLTPPPTPSPTSTPSPPPTQALNLSTRLRVQTGDNAGIAGFIITGTAPKNLLFRGIGPSLTAFGVTGALANPTLDLRDSAGVSIRANNDWQDDPAQAAAIQATGLPPQNNLEAAMVQTLDPGSYTVILRGMGMTTGVGLVEVYDLSQGVDSRLANLSTRAFVDTGDNIVIAGFVIGGSSGNDRIVARALGPSLTAFGVSNALADPILELRDSNGTLLASNNDWQDDPAQAAELTAAGLAPTNPLESGIAITLPPGAYTALLAGLNNSTGVGVVEIYDRGPSP